jgi:hypothetical protein
LTQVLNIKTCWLAAPVRRLQRFRAMCEISQPQAQ